MMPGSLTRQRSKASIGTRGTTQEPRQAIPRGSAMPTHRARVKSVYMGAAPHTPLMIVRRLAFDPTSRPRPGFNAPRRVRTRSTRGSGLDALLPCWQGHCQLCGFCLIFHGFSFRLMRGDRATLARSGFFHPKTSPTQITSKEGKVTRLAAIPMRPYGRPQASRFNQPPGIQELHLCACAPCPVGFSSKRPP